MISQQKKRALDSILKKENINVNRILIEYIIEKVDNFVEDNPQYKPRRYQLFRYFVRYILKRNVGNYDSFILFTGQKGTGKSSAAIMFAKFWCYLLDIKFKPDKHIVYSNTQVINAADTLNIFHPVVCDEAIDFAAGENWNKSENKILKQRLGKIRDKHLLFILCWPWKISKLDKVYLDSYVNYWIDLYERGHGAIFLKDMNPVSDPWNLKYFNKVGSFNEFTPTDKIRRIYRAHPNFWDLIEIPKPSDEFYQKYKKVRDRNVYTTSEMKNSVSPVEIAKAFIISAFEDIYMKSGTAKLKRLQKHIKERYNVKMNDGDLKEAFDDASKKVKKAVDDENFLNIKNKEMKT